MTRNLLAGIALLLLLLVSGGGLQTMRAVRAQALPALQGDVTCDSNVNSVDSLQILRSVAGLSTNAPCMATAADVNCDSAVNSVDSLRILRFVAGLPNSTPDGCTSIGEALTKGPSSLELIAEALQSGQIDPETAYKYQVFALFADSRLPDEYKGDDRDAGERMEILDAAGGAFDTFSPATQAELAPFFKRPEEPGSWITQETVPSQSTAGVLSGDVPVVEWTTFDAVGGKAKVWAQDRYPGDAAKAQAIATALTAKIWPDTTGPGLMDKEPKTDAGIPNNGGSDAIDFYLVHAPLDKDGVKAWLGVARASDPKNSCQLSARYLLLDSNEPLGSETSAGMLQTVTHEFFHAIQFNFPLKTGCWQPEYAWFTEASATWAEDYVYPHAQSEQALAYALLNDPQKPVDLWEENGLHQYGAYLLPYYFSRKLHAPDLVRQAWQAFGGDANSVHAIGTTIAGLDGWDGVWPEVTLYNWNREPVDDYKEVDQLERGAVPEGGVYEIGTGGIGLSGDLDHLSATYYHFKFLDEARTVQFKGNGLGAYQHINVRALLKVDGQWKQPEDWTQEREKFFCRDIAGQNLEELVIIISNSDGENEQDIDVPDAAPMVDAKDIGCDNWMGSVSTEVYYYGFVYSVDVSGLRFELDDDNGGEDGQLHYTLTQSPAVTWHASGTNQFGCTASGEMPLKPAGSAGEGVVGGGLDIDLEDEEYYGVVTGHNFDAVLIVDCGYGPGEQQWPVIPVLNTQWAPIGDDVDLVGEYVDPAQAYGGRWSWRLTPAP